MNDTPTVETYQELQEAFDFFNAEIFAGEMPQCLITLQRHKRSLGYYSAERFVAHDGKSMIDEIAMNPSYFAVLTIENTLSTLVHEMAHLWQFHFGKPSRKGYHNKEWADKMETIGLMPSNTGKEGGKRVGQQMDHYIVEGGPFDVACAKLLTKAFRLSWLDRFTEGEAESGAAADGELGEVLEKPEKNKSNRSKYRCPFCEAQVWGKPGLRVLCGADDCNAAVMEDVTEEQGAVVDE